MAKAYRVRKNCVLCKKVFFPTYSGTYYCNECKKKMGGDADVEYFRNTEKHRERDARIRIEEKLRKYENI